MDEQVSEFNDGQTVMASRQGQSQNRVKLLHLWSVAGLQWSVSIKGGTGVNHWEQSLYALIQQTSYCRQSVKFFLFGAEYPQTCQGARADPCPLPKAPTMGT